MRLLKLRKRKKSIILYTLVDEELSEYLKTKSANAKIPCFGVLGGLITVFQNFKTGLFKYT